MNIIPFGEVENERLDICKKYGLLECSNGIWRMTEKARKNYEPTSFIYYLQGKKEKPDRIGAVVEKVEIPKMTPQEEIKTSECQQIINEILSM